MSEPVDVAMLAPGLQRREPGIWFGEAEAAISYPAEGNAIYRAVEDASFWFRHRNRCIAAVAQRFPPAGPLLDVGGGNGYVSRGLEAHGIRCIVLEPGLEGALAAHARGVAAVICARLEDVRFPEASLHAIGMFDVLEHFADDATILATTARLLRPGGRLYISVPAYQMLFSDDDTIAGHFRRYTLSRLSGVLDRAGFDLDYGTYIFWPLPPAIFLWRTLPAWLGFHRGIDADRTVAEHSGGFLTPVLLKALEFEARLIARGGSIGFGGSCLVCARRR